MHVIPRLILYRRHFWQILEPILTPNGSHNWVKKYVFSMSILEPFFSGPEALQVPLESVLERLMLVLIASKTQKILFSNRKTTLFAKAAFRYFQALESILEPIFALLSKFWSQNELQNDPTLNKKLEKNFTKKMSTVAPHFSNFGSTFGSILGSKAWAKRQPKWTGMTPKWARMTPMWARMTWKWAKMAPRWAKMTLGWSQDRPRWPRNNRKPLKNNGLSKAF